MKIKKINIINVNFSHKKAFDKITSRSNSYIKECCDIALKTLSNKKSGTGRTYPPEPGEKNIEKLTTEEKKISIQMMRVNLAGEVAAQALYRGQSLVCKDVDIKKHLIEAGDEVIIDTRNLEYIKKN